MTAETPSLMVQCCRCESCMAGTRPAEANDEAHVFPSRQPGPRRARATLLHEGARKRAVPALTWNYCNTRAEASKRHSHTRWCLENLASRHAHQMIR